MKRFYRRYLPSALIAMTGLCLLYGALTVGFAGQKPAAQITAAPESALVLALRSDIVDLRRQVSDLQAQNAAAARATADLHKAIAEAAALRISAPRCDQIHMAPSVAPRRDGFIWLKG